MIYLVSAQEGFFIFSMVLVLMISCQNKVERKLYRGKGRILEDGNKTTNMASYSHKLAISAPLLFFLRSC